MRAPRWLRSWSRRPLVGGGAVAGWHLKRGKRPDGPVASANRDVNLDVGEIVHVDAWNADGTASDQVPRRQLDRRPGRGRHPVAGPAPGRAKWSATACVVEQI